MLGIAKWVKGVRRRQQHPFFSPSPSRGSSELPLGSIFILLTLCKQELIQWTADPRTATDIGSRAPLVCSPLHCSQFTVQLFPAIQLTSSLGHSRPMLNASQHWNLQVMQSKTFMLIVKNCSLKYIKSRSINCTFVKRLGLKGDDCCLSSC